MATYLLIHGSLIGGWCWNKVKKNLENCGHIVHAPDLPGHSTDRKIFAKEITLEKYVSFVSNLVNEIEEKIILVGHSLGGAIITKATENFINKVAKIVYVCAIVPESGDKVGELLERDSISDTNNSTTIDKVKMQIEVDFDKIDELLFNGCDKSDIAYAKKYMVPQPLIPFTEPIVLERDKCENLDRIGVVCTIDKSLSPALQEKMYKNARCKIAFLKSGHAPYFSKADELTEILLGCAK